MYYLFILRSSHRRCSVKKGVLRNFVKFTGKHLCQSLFFNKVAGLRRGFFCYEFAPYFWGTSLWEHLNLSFEKALLSLIIHFKGTFTYRYLCFVHDSQIFNILQLLLIIYNSSYICVSCVHNLKLCFVSFFTKTIFKWRYWN